MRATRRKAKPGEILMFYGRLPNDAPDFLICWGDGDSMKRRSNIIYDGFNGKRMRMDVETMQPKWDASFLEQLESAGFDMTTIQFSIQMKKDKAQ